MRLPGPTEIFCLFDDDVYLVLADPCHFHEGIRFDHRQVIVGKVTLFDEVLGKFIFDTVK